MFQGLGSYFGGAVQSEAAKAEAELEKDRTGLTSISFDINEINFDHLRKKRAFYKGVNIGLNEAADKQEVIDFTDLPDILPLKAAGQGFADLNYDDLAKTTKSEEEQKLALENQQSASTDDTQSKPAYVAPAHLFDYDSFSPKEQETYLSRFELIKKRKIEFRPENTNAVKMVALIVNTYSG